MGYCSQAAPYVELKAAHLLAVYLAHGGHRSHIVHIGQAAGFVAAAGKGNFKLSTEILTVFVPEQKTHGCLGVRRYVE